MSDSTTEGRLSVGQWLDRLDNIAALDVMLHGHGAAAAAVRQSLAQIDSAVTAITQRLKASQDGRLIYAGAGSSVRIGVQDGVE